MRVLLLLCLTHAAYAVSISFIGPCSNVPLLESSFVVSEGVSVGQLTIKALEKANVEYKGSEAHLQSAFNTPYGLDAMEVISDSQMRSHGWCFDVNGLTSQVYPNDYTISNKDYVLWYYCYVSYDSGVWSSTHQKTYKIAPDQFCK